MFGSFFVLFLSQWTIITFVGYTLRVIKKKHPRIFALFDVYEPTETDGYLMFVMNGCLILISRSLYSPLI